MSENKNSPCELCGQPVKVPGFGLQSSDGVKEFCCAGCLSIFQLLNPEPKPSNPKPKPSSVENIS